MAKTRTGDRHKHPGITVRPTSDVRERLEAIAGWRRVGLRTVIAAALAEYVETHADEVQLADVAGFDRSAELIDRVNGSAGLFAESR